MVALVGEKNQHDIRWYPDRNKVKIGATNGMFLHSDIRDDDYGEPD